mmetsp:Transcript_19620/g.49871  ORF Transcript_19620/g.49871 Transcript_19620/m.49871 type:complete len:200 (-) Transcript_19620:905-1504(-)
MMAQQGFLLGLQHALSRLVFAQVFALCCCCLCRCVCLHKPASRHPQLEAHLVSFLVRLLRYVRLCCLAYRKVTQRLLYRPPLDCVCDALVRKFDLRVHAPLRVGEATTLLVHVADAPAKAPRGEEGKLHAVGDVPLPVRLRLAQRKQMLKRALINPEEQEKFVAELQRLREAHIPTRLEDAEHGRANHAGVDHGLIVCS